MADLDADILQRKQAMLAPISVIDLLFIDPAEELPLVLARLRLVISKLKIKLT